MLCPLHIQCHLTICQWSLNIHSNIHSPELVIELFRKRNGAWVGQLSVMYKLLGSISEPHTKINTNQQQNLNTEAKTEYDWYHWVWVRLVAKESIVLFTKELQGESVHAHIEAHTGTQACVQEGGIDTLAVCQREKFSEQSEICLEEQNSLLSKSIFLSLSYTVISLFTLSRETWSKTSKCSQDSWLPIFT